MIFGNNPMYGWLQRSMDLSAERQKVLMGNISNVETPNYKARDLEFSDHLVQQLNYQNRFGPAPMAPRATVREGVEPGLDGNTVDLEQEIVQITANRVFYELATEVLTRKVSMLRYSVTEGGL